MEQMVLDTCDYVVSSQTVATSAAWNAADCDSDGVTNGDEVTDGTDPLNADSDGDGVAGRYRERQTEQMRLDTCDYVVCKSNCSHKRSMEQCRL